jgi:hypothetical protein
MAWGEIELRQLSFHHASVRRTLRKTSAGRSQTNSPNAGMPETLAKGKLQSKTKPQLHNASVETRPEWAQALKHSNSNVR